MVKSKKRREPVLFYLLLVYDFGSFFQKKFIFCILQYLSREGSNFFICYTKKKILNLIQKIEKKFEKKNWKNWKKKKKIQFYWLFFWKTWPKISILRLRLGLNYISLGCFGFRTLKRPKSVIIDLIEKLEVFFLTWFWIFPYKPNISSQCCFQGSFWQIIFYYTLFL